MDELAIPGLRFPEGPRWRDGTWWLSDQLGDRILRVNEAGDHTVVHEVAKPSGLGFAPDGALLAVTMDHRNMIRIDADGAREVADLRDVAGHLNDMCVGPDGRASRDAYGDHFDTHTHSLQLVVPGEPVRQVADRIKYPNGIALTPDGSTLLVSETFARCITAFAVDPADGSLVSRRVWAELPEDTNPDGLCLDAAGDVWVASYLSGEFFHVREGGEVLERFSFPGRWALSCSLGGDNGRTLLLCTAETSQDDYFAGRAIGHLDLRRVDVPGVGCP
ncbi:MAG TPA: SMP-30/gluconolactonase/LRE family protein [Acidimicrobiia bacterium]|nr:SMP-30/gluconolactonase/LRE family protein [Acidimicrobiia bacterium]